MIDLLDEVIEIPFEIYWNKYQEMNKGKYERLQAEMQWFYMHNPDRLKAFESLASGNFIKGQDPFNHLKSFCL